MGANFRTGKKSAPREFKSLNLVGANLRTGKKSAPRKLRIFNLVGANFRTGRKWAPRKLRILHFVGQSFWLGLFSKVSADSHFGVKWNWPDALTPYPPVLWVCVFRMPDQCCSWEYLRHYFNSFLLFCKNDEQVPLMGISPALLQQFPPKSSRLLKQNLIRI